jgi:hypothetical protein
MRWVEILWLALQQFAGQSRILSRAIYVVTLVMTFIHPSISNIDETRYLIPSLLTSKALAKAVMILSSFFRFGAICFD